MAISPAGSAPPPAVMTAWLKAHSTPVFAVRPAETTDTKTNEDNYRTLFRLLAERNIVRVALLRDLQGIDGFRLSVRLLRGQGPMGR